MTIGLLYQGFQEDNVCEGQNRPGKNRKMSLFLLIGKLTVFSLYWCSLFFFCGPCLASPQMYRENAENQRGRRESFQPLCTLFCVSIWLSPYYSNVLNPHCCCMCYSPVATASRNVQMMCCHRQDYFSYCIFWYSVFLQTAVPRVSNWLLLT